MIKKAAAILKRKRILDVDFDFTDYESVLETILQWKQLSVKHYITLSNPHSVMLCRRDRQMFEATSRAGLVLPDGIGIIWAANILGYKNYGRVTGPQFMLYACDWGRQKGFRHFFYGGSEGVADKLAANLHKKYPGLEVAGTFCPPFRQFSEKEDREIIDIINRTNPDIVWIGLGAPKQEKWMAEHLNKINAPAMVGVGAAFDFHAGNIKWAPPLIRKFGVEWAWRLILNPKHMWRRNLDSPKFLLKVIWQRLAAMTNSNGHIVTGN
ncbi:MAG: WecB/TagA/CpsF family glycosyltransferase [Sedimentisphaerales bacterium]|nr:WecB/TagA/CpsF family glycosyltransferase [Sedimentisphaerales bacterium]